MFGVLLALNILMSSSIFVKEKVAESLIDVQYISTHSILVDPLTKGLPIAMFQEHVSQMGLLGA